MTAQLSEAEAIAKGSDVIKYIQEKLELHGGDAAIVALIASAQFLSAIEPREYREAKRDMVHYFSAIADKLHRMRLVMRAEEN